MEIVKLIRVPYGKKNTLDEDKEYQMVGAGPFSPVETLGEWERQFPQSIIQIVNKFGDVEYEVNNN